MSHQKSAEDSLHVCVEGSRHGWQVHRHKRRRVLHQCLAAHLHAHPHTSHQVVPPMKPLVAKSGVVSRESHAASWRGHGQVVGSGIMTHCSLRQDGMYRRAQVGGMALEVHVQTQSSLQLLQLREGAGIAAAVKVPHQLPHLHTPAPSFNAAPTSDSPTPP